MVTVGSSPLARGLLPEADYELAVQRIIPARAGFTQLTRRSESSPRDHPRSRGVYGGRHLRQIRGDGSSPLARGLLARLLRTSCAIRIIPARAGFTCVAAWRSSCTGDHPRSRGVYRMSPPAEAMRRGSSPLARGLLHQGGGRFQAARIIPARAGFTRRPPPAAGRTTDHPRSRGVYARCGGRRPSGTGIIPARAGFTPTTPRTGRRKPDHPRSRGVYNNVIHATYNVGGSSPLARGLRVVHDGGDRLRWIIPARAGFTRTSPESGR